ncbi:hypothetical protein [Nitratifractor sp.]
MARHYHGPPTIGVKMKAAEWKKARRLLPPPTMEGRLDSAEGRGVIATALWVFEGSATTPRALLWLSDIRLAIEAMIEVPFERLEEPIGGEELTGEVYRLGDLARALRCERRRYPTPLFPDVKRAFASSLGRYAKRLRERRLLTFEAVIAAALRFYDALPPGGRPKGERLKVCFGASRSAYEWVLSLDLPPKLEGEELREALRRGAAKTNEQRRSEAKATRAVVEDLLNAGFTQKRIAETLQIGIATVKRHAATIRRGDS